MLVGVYLDPRRSSTTSKSAESGAGWEGEEGQAAVGEKARPGAGRGAEG